ncbi:hypothetical protein BpHYR1_003286 [Brachionus plicatilis]|uniref:Uncharacterized protein n=1 Tax=Brachionus plicatilis TaxID=10195 RepID=A0A3M7PLK3_BRAPC|nr:hypothetical protein BpHYR1_003286 [Brachionus plicatilis]
MLSNIKNYLHLPGRVHLLANFLAQKCPDIVLLNEIKIDLSEANIYLDFHSYQFMTKPRNNLYNPPNVLLNFENYILGGDLKARTKQIGCVGENENGIMLERIINE